MTHSRGSETTSFEVLEGALSLGMRERGYMYQKGCTSTARERKYDGDGG